MPQCRAGEKKAQKKKHPFQRSDEVVKREAHRSLGLRQLLQQGLHALISNIKWGLALKDTRKQAHKRKHDRQTQTHTHTHSLFIDTHMLCAILLKPQLLLCPSVVPCLHLSSALVLYPAYTVSKPPSAQRAQATASRKLVLVKRPAARQTNCDPTRGEKHRSFCICKGTIYIMCNLHFCSVLTTYAFQLHYSSIYLPICPSLYLSFRLSI